MFHCFQYLCDMAFRPCEFCHTKSLAKTAAEPHIITSLASTSSGKPRLSTKGLESHDYRLRVFAFTLGVVNLVFGFLTLQQVGKGFLDD